MTPIKYSFEYIKQLTEQYTAPEAAQATGHNMEGLRGAARRYGLKFPPGKGMRGKAITDAQVRSQKGKTTREAAKALGVSQSYVSRRAKECGIVLSQKPRCENNIPRPDRPKAKPDTCWPAMAEQAARDNIACRNEGQI